MYRCRFKKELGSYLDNQLSESKKLKIEEHLRSCKICLQELDKLRAVSAKLKSWHMPELDSSFDSSLRNEIVSLELERGQVKMKRKTWLVLVPSGALAGILLLVFLQAGLRKGVHGELKYSSDKIGEEVNRETIPTELARRRQYNPDLGSYGVKTSISETEAEDMFNGKVDRIISSGAVEEYRKEQFSEYDKDYTRTGGSTVLLAQPQDGSIIVIQPVLPATGEGTQIIRTADIQLEVENGKDTYKKASQICQELGGYLAESNFYKDTEGRESGKVTLRIPKDKFTLALDKLGSLGKVISLNTNSQDVSQEYANLKARLEVAMVAYNKMFEALQKRRVTAPEAIRIESELTPVRQRVEDLRNQIERLNNLTSFTTININFYEARASLKVLQETRRLIKESFLRTKIEAIKWFAENLTFVIVGIILALIALGAALAIAYLASRFIKRS